MIRIHPLEEHGHVEMDWLDSRHHFSFGHYYNPKRLNFGPLRVVNDDTILPHSGFDMHPHRDMEIITYVRSGAITHKDSLGNHGRTVAGDVQVMSAGTGIVHAEHNFEDTNTTLFQIWIEPNRKGVQPRWEARKFPDESKHGELTLLASGRSSDAQAGALFIYQDAALYGAKLRENESTAYEIDPNRRVYVIASDGQFAVNGQLIRQGDSAEIRNESELRIDATEDCELLVIDLP
ncbi:MAG: pirin family protein [Alphaproteobacteria bacterium]|nr:pirin family protein [Alphaproteobacteria bacterium]